MILTIPLRSSREAAYRFLEQSQAWIARQQARRPAARVFVDDPARRIESRPSLTQPPRIPAEAGRIEFKAFDPCPDPAL